VGMAKSTRRPRRRVVKPTSGIRRLPLGSLRVFVAVAEHLSFTRAAASLGVTVSAASMQIQALEQHLGLPLFRRAGRTVELTAEGVQLLPRVREGLGILQGAIDDARSVRGGGALRISTLHSFLLQWLLPRLPDFEITHPKIDLLVETSNTVVDFNRSNIHAAVRMGKGNWPGLHTEKIMDEWLVPVCSPAMLARLGPVDNHDDLKRYRLLHSSSEPWSVWPAAVRDESWDETWPERGSAFDDSTAIVRSAEAGAGLALARWSLVANEVNSGRLVVASRHVTAYGRAYYFVCPTRLRSVAKVCAFRDWLMAQGAGHSLPHHARRNADK
jgi:LysR family transcriptional regulator, glycine cleavage system transcriptional activator